MGRLKRFAVAFVAVAVSLSTVALYSGTSAAFADPSSPSAVPAVPVAYADFGTGRPTGSFVIPQGGGPATQIDSNASQIFVYDSKGDLVYDTNNILHLKPGNGGPLRTLHAPLDAWYGAAFDASDNLYLATSDTGNEPGYVEKISDTGIDLGRVATDIDGYVSSVAVDAAGNIFVGLIQGASAQDNNRVVEVHTDGTRTIVAAAPAIGEANDLAFDSSGSLYVTDLSGGSIWKFTPNGTTFTQTRLVGLSFPQGLGIDAYDNVYVAENQGFGGAGNIDEIAAGTTTPVVIGQTAFAQALGVYKGVPSTVNTGSSDVFVSDINGMYRVAPPLPATTSIDTSNTSTPLAEDDNGNIYEGNADGDTIAKLSHDGTYLGTFFNDPSVTVLNEAFDNEGDMYANVQSPTTGIALVKIPATGGTTSTPIATGVFVALAVGFDDTVYDYDANTSNIVEIGGSGATTMLPITQPFPPTGISVDKERNVWTVAFNLAHSSIFEYPADGSPPIDHTFDWQTGFGSFDPSLPLIGYEISVDGSDNIFISASLLFDQFEPSNGIWEKAAGSPTFVQITRTDVATTDATNGEEVAAIATARNAAPSAAPSPTVPSISGAPPSAVAGVPYSFGFAVSGSPTPTVAVTAGSLPTGMTLSSDGDLTGTPTLAGSYPITLVADNGTATTATESTTLTVGPGAATTIQIKSGDGQTTTTNSTFTEPLTALVSDAFGNAVPGQNVRFTDTETPHNADFANSNSSGGFGPTYDATTDANGIATSSTLSTAQSGGATGAVDIDVTATGVLGIATYHLTVTAPAAPAGISGTPTVGTAGVAYAFAFTTTGSPAPTVAVTTGALPVGLNLSPAGVLTGTTTTAGNFTFAVSASNGTGAAATRTVTLTIASAPPAHISIFGGSGQNAHPNAAFANPLVVGITDAYGNPVSGVAAHFADTETPHLANFGGSSSIDVTTSAGGIATAPTLTAGAATGTASIQATAAGVANTVTFSLTVSTTPSAPSAVSASAANGAVTVRWTPPSGNGGSPITGYVVTPYLAGVAQPTKTFAATATSGLITGLTNGKTYTFKVAAKNANGTGTQSAPTAAVIAGTPTPPATVAATAHSGSVTVSWSASAANGSPITGYVVTPYLAGVAQPTKTFAATATSGLITGLTNGKTYTFKVAAKNANGTGTQSAPTAAVIAGTPTPPATVAATADSGSVTVSWSASAANGSPITGYVVTPYLAGVAQPTKTFAATATSGLITGLTNGKTYTFKVAAKNANGTGTQSAPTAAVIPH